MTKKEDEGGAEFDILFLQIPTWQAELNRNTTVLAAPPKH
jgi:hypothetical protein